MKLTKVEAVYLPAEYVSHRGASCGSCRDFITITSECSITEDAKVSGPKGVCTQYIFGKPRSYGTPLKLIPKDVVGYIEGLEVPTFCGACKFYKYPDRLLSVCAKVGDSGDDRVEHGGCCNSFVSR